MSTRDELESIILFRSQEGAESDRSRKVKNIAIATGALGLAGGGIHVARKLGQGISSITKAGKDAIGNVSGIVKDARAHVPAVSSHIQNIAKSGEDAMNHVSGVFKDVHANAVGLGKHVNELFPKAEAYINRVGPQVEGYFTNHFMPMTHKAKETLEGIHKGTQFMRDYGAIYGKAREGALFIPKFLSNPKKWWGERGKGWAEGRHGAAAATDPYYLDPELAERPRRASPSERQQWAARTPPAQGRSCSGPHETSSNQSSTSTSWAW